MTGVAFADLVVGHVVVVGAFGLMARVLARARPSTVLAAWLFVAELLLSVAGVARRSQRTTPQRLDRNHHPKWLS